SGPRSQTSPPMTGQVHPESLPCAQAISTNRTEPLRSKLIPKTALRHLSLRSPTARFWLRREMREDPCMTAPMDPRSPLREFVKVRDFFIGIDSDGCAFDSMEVKHKECFIPTIIRTYDLAAISKYVRETAEFVNLYSKHRGINRFPGLVLTI